MTEGKGVIQRPCIPDGIQDGLPCHVTIPILDVALDDTNARVGIHYCLHPEYYHGDSPTDANAILNWGNKTVVGVLKPVIEV